MRVTLAPVIAVSLLVACSAREGASVEPGSDVLADAVADGAGLDGGDAGADPRSECPDGSQLEDDECVEISSCAEDPQLCGPPELARCEEGADGSRCICDAAALRAELTRDVGLLDLDGAVPSVLVVSGRSSFPLLTDEGGRVFAAGAIHGDGRVLTIAHEGLMNRGPDTGGFSDLVVNVAEWLVGPAPAPRVAVGSSEGGAGENLAAAGYDVTTISLIDDLDGFVLFVSCNYIDYTPTELRTIHAWVEAGGGLLSGGHAWWWGRDRDDEVENFPGNRLLRPFGIVVTGETSDTGTFEVAAALSSDLHQATCAMDALLGHLESPQDSHRIPP